MYTSDKTLSMRIRMTPAQHKHICDQAIRTGMTASAYIRSLISRDIAHFGGAIHEDKSPLLHD